MYLSIGAQEISGVDGSFSPDIGRSPSCLFHDDTERSQIPGFGSPVQSCFDCSLGDQHVLPDPAEAAAISRGVGEASNFFSSFLVLGRSCTGGEYHRLAQPRDIRNVHSFAIAIGTLAAVRPPSPAQRGRADHSGDDFSITLNAEECAKSRNAA